MQPLPAALAPWHEFYTLLGEAAATMIGLLFVAASVGRGVFSQNRLGPLRMFLSGSVVQLATVMANSLFVLAPLRYWELLGGVVLACGCLGLVYSGMAWRDTVRDGLSAKIDLEDRLWYAVAPAAGYLVAAISGVAMILRREFACPVLAGAMGTLMLVAIHNAWDITIWSVTRRKE
jgi:hypothetical protein